MKRETKKTVRLTQAEVQEAVREYISLHTCGEVTPGENMTVAAALSSRAKHHDFEIEATWFEGDLMEAQGNE